MKKNWAAMLALALSLASQATRAAADAPLLEAARAAEPAVIETLREMVHLESGTTDAPGVAKMVGYVEQRLAALGMQPQRLKGSFGHAEMVKGTATGTGKLKVLLIAHVDTVYLPGILATQPYKREGNKLFGPGIADSKGGVAVILHSLALLKAQGWRDYAQLTVLFNGDEEGGSRGSADTLAELGAAHDVVLSYEPTGAKEVAKVESVLLGAAGGGSVTLEVRGRAAHAGVAPDQGRNAFIELAHRALQTRDIAKGIEGAQLNWTLGQFGLASNQIPERAYAIGNVRLMHPDAAARLQAALEAKIAEPGLVPDTQVTLKFEMGRPPFLAGERGKALAEMAKRIYAEMDGRALAFVPMTGGGTDASFVSRSGKAAVLESMGLAGWGFHARDEYIEIDSIAPRLYLTMRMLKELAAR